ncbi:hypothetical protein F4054_03860 [Candidatus Poribacteria bacterium]|nr:hypothetical protein [Candidatus Poribacteria bacterium]MYG08014.1 hypothetical protein [Candidatus Poribacteria bacterium]MYK21377.1 hypothetical protein [Candidatus Poribacteria bacterium]
MGPLSNSEVIQTLNENFVNTPGLLRDLPELIDGSEGERVSLFAKTLKDHFVYPVDIQVLTPKAELIMPQPDKDLPHKNRTEYYLTLLAGATNGETVNLAESTQALDLSLSKRLMEVLNVFRGPGDGYQDYTPVEIDATPFEQGGTLIIDIKVGKGEATGSFDLFAGDAELPTEGFPEDALASEWDIPPGDTGQIRYPFAHGQKFKLGATGNWFCEKGSTNAFLVRVSVVPTETTEAEASS